MTEAGRYSWRFLAGVGGLALLTGGATIVAVALGQPALGLVPVLAAVAGWALWHAPVRYPALAVLALAGGTDKPQEVPYLGEWTSPVQGLGNAVFNNLNNVVGVAALRFSVVDLLVFGMLALLAYRRLVGDRTDEAGTVPAPRCMRDALVLSLLGALVLEAWGMARGGDVKQSLWQLRQLVVGPLYGLLFLQVLRGPRDHAPLGALVVGCACLKALLAFYFYWAICRPQGIEPHYATGHDDTMLFALAVVLVLARWHERSDRTGWLLLLWATPVVALGMYANNRRLVYVSAAAALLAVSTLVPWTRLKRAATRTLLVAVPLVPLYLAAGWSSGSALFAPAQLVKSVVSAEADRSTATRDIENFNLYWTLKAHPLLGTGWGHEYDEVVRADDISAAFPQYRYIPHNSLLGLWAFGGVVGFSMLWVFVPLTVFLAARAYRHARTPGDRTAALCCVAVVVIYSLQAYGDMGVQSWLGMLMMAAAAAVAAKLAVATGAFPGPVAAAPAGGELA